MKGNPFKQKEEEIMTWPPSDEDLKRLEEEKRIRIEEKNKKTEEEFEILMNPDPMVKLKNIPEYKPK